ncbi:MAG: hypothetical protein A4E49_00835 [Methanosaeta sp. PtaU1.Bin112]|nr:MAG: hypothetical protein A4E49_00835 [Methanosaeta sp. PtaU1.Bin112]
MEFLQNTHVCQLRGDVQAGLASDAGNDSVRPLLLDDLGDDLRDERLNVDLIRGVRIGHDGGRIGVNQHDLDPLFAQRLARLRSGEIKLRRLSDLNGTRTDEQNLMNIISLWHLYRLPALPLTPFMIFWTAPKNGSSVHSGPGWASG